MVGRVGCVLATAGSRTQPQRRALWLGCRARIVLPSVVGVDYRYELRRGDEVVATGHMSREEPLEVGDRLEINGQLGIVRTIEPLLGDRELRLAVQLVRDRI